MGDEHYYDLLLSQMMVLKQEVAPEITDVRIGKGKLIAFKNAVTRHVKNMPKEYFLVGTATEPKPLMIFKKRGTHGFVKKADFSRSTNKDSVHDSSTKRELKNGT